ncbi:hypothetical protein K1719_037395 [Acacia pycnantha]|nr:hypothetical protein K1719_037395 [Acacia pycnantha]
MDHSEEFFSDSNLSSFVFSEGDYDRTKVCLVYPVFYNVVPSEVRHQRGHYGAEMAKHEEKFKGDKLKVQQWRSALYDYEYQFIEEIIVMVSNKLHPKRLHVANYPIGLEYRASQVLSLFNFNSDCVNMIGICGIGKTTLARSVYNFILDRFEGSCFLADVRESSIKHGLEHLQELILFDILGEKNVKLGDSHKGIPILLKKLHNKKVVLILDDVDKLEQLRKLVGDRDIGSVQEVQLS